MSAASAHREDTAALALPEASPGVPAAITLDISRLLSRARHATPTGIDRVELAYARALLSDSARDVRFEAWVPGLGFLVYRRRAVEQLLDRLARRWRTGEAPRLGEAVRTWFGLLPVKSRSRGRVRLVVSHNNLSNLARRVRAWGATRTCVYLHDTIPSDYPEYARPGGAAKHGRRLRNGVAVADAVIVNSESTARTLERFMPDVGRPQLLVAPPGIELGFDGQCPRTDATDGPPYFLCIGTIEPRKNHLLLLQVWRALAERLQEPLPRLVLVGRRGWENENVVDLIERSTALQQSVVEIGRIGDEGLAGLLAGARAVLMPSFAEGFGLPVAEAIAAGVPVIASDIAALRETGGSVPDYLDPLDGLGWMRAIRDYAHPDSPMRAAQLERMRDWQPPRWDRHFARVLPFLDAL